jgi:hypothetical protein
MEIQGYQETAFGRLTASGFSSASSRNHQARDTKGLIEEGRRGE